MVVEVGETEGAMGAGWARQGQVWALRFSPGFYVLARPVTDGFTAYVTLPGAPDFTVHDLPSLAACRAYALELREMVRRFRCS